jgi:hypothetical protein
MLKQVRQIVTLATARKRDQLPPDSTEDTARRLAVGSG